MTGGLGEEGSFCVKDLAQAGYQKAVSGSERLLDRRMSILKGSRSGPPPGPLAWYTGLGDARNILEALLCDVAICVGHGAGPGTISELLFALAFGKPTVLVNGWDSSIDESLIRSAIDRVTREGCSQAPFGKLATVDYLSEKLKLSFPLRDAAVEASEAVRRAISLFDPCQPMSREFSHWGIPGTEVFLHGLKSWGLIS